MRCSYPTPPNIPEEDLSMCSRSTYARAWTYERVSPRCGAHGKYVARQSYSFFLIIRCARPLGIFSYEEHLCSMLKMDWNISMSTFLK